MAYDIVLKLHAYHSQDLAGYSTPDTGKLIAACSTSARSGLQSCSGRSTVHISPTQLHIFAQWRQQSFAGTTEF